MLLLDFNSLFVRFSISLSLVSPCVSQVEYKFLIFALDAEAPRYCLASNECSSISQSCWGPPWTAGRPARHPRRTGLPGCGRRAGRPGGSKAGLGAAGGIPPLLKQLPFVDLRGTLLNIAASSQAVCSGGSSSSSGAAAHSWKLPRSRS